MKLWQIPDGGIVGSLTDWIIELRGHMKKINYIDWHPTAANILLSAAADFKVLSLLDIKCIKYDLVLNIKVLTFQVVDLLSVALLIELLFSNVRFVVHIE